MADFSFATGLPAGVQASPWIPNLINWLRQQYQTQTPQYQTSPVSGPATASSLPVEWQSPMSTGLASATTAPATWSPANLPPPMRWGLASSASQPAQWAPAGGGAATTDRPAAPAMWSGFGAGPGMMPAAAAPTYDPHGGIPSGGAPPRPTPLPQPRPPEAALAAASPQGGPIYPNALPTLRQFLAQLGSIPGRFTQDLLGSAPGQYAQNFLGSTGGPSLIDSLLAKLKGASFGAAPGSGLYPAGQDQ